MKNKEFNKKIMTTVTIFAMLLSTTTPIFANMGIADTSISVNAKESTETIINFDDENNRGGFKTLHGNGTVTFENQKMKLQANDVTIIGSDQLPQYESGYMEFDIHNMSQGRIGFIFRQTDPLKFQGIAYDVSGGWVWLNNNNTKKIEGVSADIKYRQDQRVRIEYVGNEISLFLDNKLIFTQVNEEFKESLGEML